MINRTTISAIRVAAAALLLGMLVQTAQANRRHFTYTYESPVLPSGSREIEIWNTLRTDKGAFFRGLDHRMELEWGLGAGLQSSLYFNLSSESAADGLGGIASESEYSFSNEWKWSLTNPVADALGSALYAEWTVEHDATELEGKVILDKQVGNLLFAANGTFEHEFPALGNETNNTAEATLGIAYLIDEFSVGIEARHHTRTIGEESYSGLFVGPSLSFSGKNWWAAASVMPQIGIGANKNNTNENLELLEHEKLEVRFLLSFEL
ncbi:MAG: hypothetical protein JSS75_12880 [Bacteroidetes bacterium]|nr:hypothetical protein [Bacteroidota bacterium]